MKAIQVHDVAKRFKIYYDRNRTLKERLLFRKRNRYDERWVLKDISFDIEQGEAVGLVGENGCGKSTTLKLLSRILFPDRGAISVNGRVSCLIELGAGFHPDMNGIENIYLNAAMFGVGRKETGKRLDRIIAFSELEPFIENPIRTYSSGMYMRLAFSVAINVDADVLLIDEILAVGDMNFQEKCLARLREIKERGATIVIVSHSLGQIEAFCDRSIWIDGGRVRADGTPAETHARYAAFMNGKKSQ
ncbi:ABC transporter ATP-binding protein [Pyramidobacter sp.]|uniref:ABC transporter ATP-binding protein n=1 Tax=Pyramidobacter sp. TaxID=1943581 RepID=UPI00331E0ACC